MFLPSMSVLTCVIALCACGAPDASNGEQAAQLATTALTETEVARTDTRPQQTDTMSASLTNPTVKAAIEALNAHDRATWEALFAHGATFSDDGNEGSISSFTNNAFGKGKERFTSIEKVENNGLDVYGRYHSDTWGDFKTYFKFHVSEGRITRLEVGQANY